MVAVMLVKPTALLATRPVTLIAATDGALDVHVTSAVRSFTLPSLYVPLAPSCVGWPDGIVDEGGVTAMAESVTTDAPGVCGAPCCGSPRGAGVCGASCWSVPVVTLNV